jgi:hypothetical protein
MSGIRCRGLRPHHWKGHDEVLGIGELRTPAPLMLDDSAPEADLAVDAVLCITNPAQVVEALGTIPLTPSAKERLQL